MFKLTSIVSASILIIIFSVLAVYYLAVPESPSTSEYSKLTLITIDDSLKRPDGIDFLDVTGNGLDDVLVTSETAQVYWYSQNSADEFRKHLIRDSSKYVGDTMAENEGAAWTDLDNNGHYEAVILDQRNGSIRLYVPKAHKDLRGDWKEVVIQTDRPNLQDVKVFDIDKDQKQELVYTWEGLDGNTGGVHWLDHIGDNLLNEKHYQDYTAIQQPGAWWLADQRADLDNDYLVDDIVFTSRSHANPNAKPGIYWLEQSEDPRYLWKKFVIDDEDKDWLHVDLGNFYRRGNKDVIAQSYDGTVRIYNYENNFSMDEITVDPGLAGHNVLTAPETQNGRDTFITIGQGNKGQKGAIVHWRWDGDYWQKNILSSGTHAKLDDRIIWWKSELHDSPKLLTIDSVKNYLGYFDVVN